MKFIAAYLMACLGADAATIEGVAPAAALPTKDDVCHILCSVGTEVEWDRLDLLFELLEGKDIAELIATGQGAARLRAVWSRCCRGRRCCRCSC
jgi:ribosomal protein L12E/L44/L45/RPP1/RPP2